MPKDTPQLPHPRGASVEDARTFTSEGKLEQATRYSILDVLPNAVISDSMNIWSECILCTHKQDGHMWLKQGWPNPAGSEPPGFCWEARFLTLHPSKYQDTVSHLPSLYQFATKWPTLWGYYRQLVHLTLHQSEHEGLVSRQQRGRAERELMYTYWAVINITVIS